MTMLRIIPCLDVRDGRVVKGIRFASLRDAGDPTALAARYEAEGADELVLLDVSATAEGRSAALETVQQVREVLSIPLCVGGGVRSVFDAERLLSAGADKVAVNSAAVRDPSLLSRMADRFGRQCTVLSLDAAQSGEDQWETVIDAGTKRTGLEARHWAMEAAERGAGEILLTSWDRDGTKSGYDLALIRCIAAAVPLPIIASGGASGDEDLLAAARSGATGVLAASIFHEGTHMIRDIKESLRALGAEVRMPC